MKTTVKTLMLAGLFFAATVISSQAISEHEHHHPGTRGESPAGAMPGMMMEKMQMKHPPQLAGDMPCKAAGAPCNGPCTTTAAPPARHHMKGAWRSGMRGTSPGMMHQRMERAFYLDRVEILGLTPDQMTRLKTIRSDCRKENIRNAAEVQILRLDLKELLNDTDWSLKATEPLIRKIQDLEGDMLVRHLQAITEARSVLSAEQLQKADSGGWNDDLDELFE